MAIVGAKKKRVSKKNKISWRKHSKVGDIENFLYEQCEEERLGAPLQELSNEQLFIVDTEPQEELLPLREKRKRKATRPLKGFSALQPHTRVPDPIKKRNRVKTEAERKSKFVKEKEASTLKPKEIVAITERRLDEIRRENVSKQGEFTKDLWNNNNVYLIEKDPWLNSNTIKYHLRNSGIPVKTPTKDLLKKKSVIPAVELPHPGMSYNPSFKDHQDLLQIIAKEETEIIKEEQHIKRVTKNMFRKVPEDKKQNEWLQEMSEGLEKLDETKLSNSDVEDDKISVNPPVKNKKKTLKQRRKRKEQLELEKERKTIKLEKKKMADIQRIKYIKTNIDKIESKQEKLRNLRKIKAEKRKNEPKVLNANKIEDMGLDFQMGEDIPGNLRNIKKEGNLLNDRFISLQKRNILQPTKRVHRKKAKVKKYVKPGHKDNWEVTIAKKFTLQQK